MDISQIIAAALGAFGVIIVALIGLYGAQRLGIGQNQERLVATLKALLEAQDKRIEELEKERASDIARIQKLETQVKELTELTVAQALELEKLRHQGGSG